MSASDKRCRPESTSIQADLVALAKDKLAMSVASPAELAEHSSTPEVFDRDSDA